MIQSQERRVERLETEAGFKKTILVVWCGDPAHYPDLSAYPSGIEPIVVRTGICRSRVDGKRWYE